MERLWKPSKEVSTQNLKTLYCFIEKHRAICEAHSVDFYLKDNWSKCLPQSWREEVLSMQNNSWLDISFDTLGDREGSDTEGINVRKRKKEKLLQSGNGFV